MSEARRTRRPNRYSQIIERVFFLNYLSGARAVPFSREELVTVANELGITLPKNLGDVVYSFRYRNELPESVRAAAPEDEFWIILPAGRARYRFFAMADPIIRPSNRIDEIKIPDSTPGVIARYALSDEQALLARLRYNRLVDVFTGVTCYSLQNHLRTTVPDMGQVETDEIYVGLDARGAHYVIPVQAKGGNDLLSIVQVIQDVGLCGHKFPDLVCRPLAAQFLGPDLIAMFAFNVVPDDTPRLSMERHYRLVVPESISDSDLASYQPQPGPPAS